MNTKAEAPIRIQLVSDRASIEALSEAAIAESINTQAHEVTVTDQRLGIAEVAAIIAIVRSSAEITQLLARAYQALRSKKKITIKSPKGSVTIEGDASTLREDIDRKLAESDIL
jgi:hypothetical protein